MAKVKPDEYRERIYTEIYQEVLSHEMFRTKEGLIAVTEDEDENEVHYLVKVVKKTKPVDRAVEEIPFLTYEEQLVEHERETKRKRKAGKGMEGVEGQATE